MKTQQAKFSAQEIGDDIDLSGTVLSGHLIKSEETFLSRFNESGGTQVYLGTNLEISEDEQEGPDQGYFNQGQVGKVKRILEQRGIGVRIRDIEDSHNLDVSLDNDVVIEVDLGYRSRDHKSARYAKAVENKFTRRSYITRALGETERDFANGRISLELFKSEGEGKELGYFMMEDLGPEAFRNIMIIYAKGYEQIMQALHGAKGKPLPNKPIVLAP